MAHILAMSDTHCQFDFMSLMFAKASKQYPDIDLILHCGDMGFYDELDLTNVSPRELHLVKKHDNPIHLFQPYLHGKVGFPVPVLVISGNHEDFSLISKFHAGTHKVTNLRPLQQGELVKVAFGNTHLNILGIGKILPTDAKDRTKPSYIQEDELERAKIAGRDNLVDILLVHEPPLLYNENPKRRGRMFGNSATRDLIMQIRPRMVLAGHMHYEYEIVMDGIPIFGLGYGVEKRYAIIDEALNVTFQAVDNVTISLSNVTEVQESLPVSDGITKVMDVAPSRAKNIRLQPPISGKEICARFGLGEQDQWILTQYFIAMRTEMLQNAQYGYHDAISFADGFFANHNGFPITLP